MRSTYSLVAVGVAMALGVAPAAAQLSCESSGSPCQVEHGISASVATVAKLSQTTASTDLGPIGAEAYAANLQSPGPSLSVDANTSWTVTVQSTANTWGYAGGTDPSKPSTDLKLSGVANGISTTPQHVASGLAGTTFIPAFLFETQWDLEDDPPGTYTLTLVFTLSAP